MGFKKFDSKDLIYNQIITNPEVKFMVHTGSIYYQNEKSVPGDFENNVKHITEGSISLHEINVNREKTENLIAPFIEKSSTRYAFRTITTSAYDDLEMGAKIDGSYPMSATISRIFIPEGREIPIRENARRVALGAHINKKYIRSLTNVINTQNHVGSKNTYGNLGTEKVNMICIPGIFYGSKINRGSLKLSTYVKGTLAGTVQDIYSDGRLFQTYNASEEPTDNKRQVGLVVYNQGIILLTSSVSLDPTNLENYESETVTTSSTWVNFGTGIPQVGPADKALPHGTCQNTSYTINFQGVNKVPTLTMYAYSKIGEDNFSHNPTFLTESTVYNTDYSKSSFLQNPINIKSINKSPYEDYEESFKNTTYISKIGIYDKYKNLIAIATLANPVKKTEKRDFMFKMGIDF